MKNGIAKKERQPKLKRDERYPMKETIGLNLLREFRKYHLLAMPLWSKYCNLSPTKAFKRFVKK